MKIHFFVKSGQVPFLEVCWKANPDFLSLLSTSSRAELLRLLFGFFEEFFDEFFATIFWRFFFHKFFNDYLTNFDFLDDFIWTICTFDLVLLKNINLLAHFLVFSFFLPSIFLYFVKWYPSFDVYLQNKTIFFNYVDFWPKIYLILYPFENPNCHI